MNAVQHTLAIAALAALALSGSAFATTTAAKSATAGTAQQERAACQAGNTHQDKATCLKEANNAAADQKKDPAKFQGKADTAANARARCEPLSGADKTDCLARAAGQGNAKGSVESGGIIRETVTQEPAVRPAAQPAAPARP